MSPPAQPTDSDAVQGLSVSVTGEILVAAVVVTFFLFVIFLVLYLRANRYLGANPSLGESYPAGSAYAGARVGTNPSHPLAPALFKSIPIAAFSPADFKEGMECAVCLNEVAVGEKIRTLPGCRHGFHLECIDMWFSSNSTCPICRCSLEAAKSENAILGEAQQRGLSDSSVANRDLPLQEVVMILPDDSVEGSSSSAGQGSRKPGRFLAIEIPVVALQNCGRVGFQRQMR